MEQLLHKFYSSFQQLDAELMVACYHEQICFEDPAFGELRGERAKDMWKMLVSSQRGKDFKIDYTVIYANEEEGRVKWEAKYIFSKTGRRVHNHIDAHFKFRDGLIIDHRDHFHLHHWAAMALGWKGRLFGGTRFFRKKMHKQTNQMLDKFQSTL